LLVIDGQHPSFCKRKNRAIAQGSARSIEKA
jgi:hypothetical protein